MHRGLCMYELYHLTWLGWKMCAFCEITFPFLANIINRLWVVLSETRQRVSVYIAKYMHMRAKSRRILSSVVVLCMFTFVLIVIYSHKMSGMKVLSQSVNIVIYCFAAALPLFPFYTPHHMADVFKSIPFLSPSIILTLIFDETIILNVPSHGRYLNEDC